MFEKIKYRKQYKKYVEVRQYIDNLNQKYKAENIPLELECHKDNDEHYIIYLFNGDKELTSFGFYYQGFKRSIDLYLKLFVDTMKGENN